MSASQIIYQFVDSNELLTTLITAGVAGGFGLTWRSLSKQRDRREPAGRYVRSHYRRTPDGTIVRVRRYYFSNPVRGRTHKPRRLQRAVIGPMATAAALLLPAADRPRYAEEYHSELWDLFQSGAGCVEQLRHVFRLAFRSVPLGVALRMPRRRGAAL